MIAIIDYGSGNIAAIANIYKQLQIPYVVTHDRKALDDASHIILPGVGAFDTTMQKLDQLGLRDTLTEQVSIKNKWMLGICVGMQILGDDSEEGVLPGLSLIPGHIRKIDESRLPGKPKLPHMGWNGIQITSDNPIFRGIDQQRGFYFLHSYFFSATNPENILSTVNYGTEMPCIVMKGSVIGMQFHPEKSHSNGTTIFRNFYSL